MNVKGVIRFSLLAIMCVCAAAVSAHGPTPKQTIESIEIDASPEDVWAVAGDFGGIAKWHPLLKDSSGKGGDKAGGGRTIVFTSGGELVESLDEYEENHHYLGYRLAEEDVNVFPVSYYTATLEVKESGQGSKVQWIARYYRGDTGNFPKPELNDAAAEKAVKAFFKEGLAGLKQAVEEK